MPRPESRMSRDVVVVDGLRTPYSRAGTELKDVPADELGRIVITELLARTDFDPAGRDQVIFGNIAQPPDAVNVARVAALKAGVPASVPAFTVNRLCGSGLQSIVDAYYRIAAGDADAIIADCRDLIERHDLDADAVRTVVARTLLGDQPLPLAGAAIGA